MTGKTSSELLLSTIKEISTVEINEMSLLIAIINNNISELINKNMKKIEDEFCSSCEYYGKNNVDVTTEKDEILNGYKDEFNKIAMKIEEEYMNLALELQENQSNQKIAITNLKKVLEAKSKYIQSEEYRNFLDKIKDLETRRDNSLKKAEFDAIVNYLDNVEDPIEFYNKKIDVFANKYIEYCGLEEACIIRLRKCNDRIEEEINSVMQYDIGQLAIKSKKSIVKVFSKMLNKIFGSKKFEKEYLFHKRENIKKIKVNTDSILEQIDIEIDNALIALEEYKLKINQTFNQTV